MQEQELDSSNGPIRFYEAPVASGVSRQGVIVFNPAMGTRARFYRPLVEVLSEQGFHVILHELRGNGISPVRARRHVDFGYLDLLRDLSALMNHVKQRFEDDPLILAGHSLGGQLSLLYSAFEPVADQLLLVACGTPHHSGFQGRRKWLLHAVPHLFTSAAAVAGYFPGDLLGFGGVQGKTLIGDWSALARTNQFSVSGDTRDYEAALAQLSVPVVAFSFESDDFAPPAAVRELLVKCPQATTRVINLANNETGFRTDHFNWVKQAHTTVPLLLSSLPQPVAV